MRNDYYTNSKDYINRWIVSYADFVTMLLALFMVMFAISQLDNQKLLELQAKLQKTFSDEPKIENVTKYHKIVEGSQSYSTQNLKMLFEKSLSQSNSIKLIKADRGLIVRVSDKMLFDEGSAQIKPQAKKALSEIIKVLTKIDNPVIIEGHTDSIPIKNAKFPSNWELSTARATNIISYLTKNSKILPKRLCAVGYGEFYPIADNTSISGRILNRRVDIIVLGKDSN